MSRTRYIIFRLSRAAILYTVVYKESEWMFRYSIWDTDSRREYALFLPNSFTPNGDGTNDSLSSGDKISVENYSFKIFNRWGEMDQYYRIWSIVGWDL